jgi:hypothetical protein
LGNRHGANGLGTKKPDRTRGTGACAGSCDDLTVTEEQITIGRRDHDRAEILGETERPLSFKSRQSPFGERPAKV